MLRLAKIRRRNGYSMNNLLISDAHLTSIKTAHLIKAYEKLNLVPEKERIFRETDQVAVDMDRLRSVYRQALSVIERSNDNFQNVEAFSDEQRVMNFIRGHMIAKTLKVGDLVVRIPSPPLDDEGNILLAIEPVVWMEPERNLCRVGDHIMPISNILARHDKQLESTAFGIPHSELLYLEHESEARPLIYAACQQYYSISNSVAVMTAALEEAGLLPKSGRHASTVPLAKESVLDKIREAKKVPKKPEKDKATQRKTGLER